MGISMAVFPGSAGAPETAERKAWCRQHLAERPRPWAEVCSGELACMAMQLPGMPEENVRAYSFGHCLAPRSVLEGYSAALKHTAFEQYSREMGLAVPAFPPGIVAVDCSTDEDPQAYADDCWGVAREIQKFLDRCPEPTMWIEVG